MTRPFGLAILLIAATRLVAMSQAPAPMAQKRPGRIATAVASAKRQGHDEVSIPALGIFPTGVDTLDMAAEKYSILLVEPVSATVSAAEGGLTTWYTLQTDEVLNRQRTDAAGDEIALPFSLRSLAPNQVLLRVSGGQATVDGVVVREAPPQHLQLRIGRKYVLVLHLQPGGRVAELAAQADGAFEVSHDGSSIRSLRVSSRLGQDVQSRWAGQLGAVRDFVKNRSGAPGKR